MRRGGDGCGATDKGGRGMGRSRRGQGYISVNCSGGGTGWLEALKPPKSGCCAGLGLGCGRKLSPCGRDPAAGFPPHVHLPPTPSSSRASSITIPVPHTNIHAVLTNVHAQAMGGCLRTRAPLPHPSLVVAILLPLLPSLRPPLNPSPSTRQPPATPRYPAAAAAPREPWPTHDTAPSRTRSPRKIPARCRRASPAGDISTAAASRGASGRR